ncbi:MAG TPA: anti-sigma factor [Chloroflexota bacterium]
MPSCSAVAELASAYLLGALEPEEAAELERHLELCPPCRESVDAERSVAESLALVVPQRTPPPRLRASLMAAVRGEPAEPRARRWRRFFPSPLAAALGAAAAASLALLVALGWAFGLQSRLDAPPAPAAVAVAAVPTPVPAGSDYPGGGALVVGRAEMRRLVGSETAPDARGWIYVDPNVDQALLVAYHLPPLAPDRSYQLWLIQNGQRYSGGLFDVDAEGYGWLKVQAPKPIASFDGVGITVEPRTGSVGPTGTRVLAGRL